MATSSGSLDKSPRKNWVENAGGLPSYIRKIARAISEKRSIPLDKAIPYAIGRVEKWAAGGDGVTPETQAKASAAIAQWEALKAKNAAVRETPEVDDDLAMTDAEILEAAMAVVDPLGVIVEVGDVKLLEAAAAPPAMSNAKRRAGESLTAWGERLKTGDKRAQATADARKKAAGKKTRGGASQDFEAQHPRGRGGSWTMKAGSSGDDVRAVQRSVGAKADGQFGTQTRAAVMNFQRKHGLQVDGVVGAQTVAAMRGEHGAAQVKPGQASARDRAWLTKRAQKKAAQVQESALTATIAVGDLALLTGITESALKLPMGEDLRLAEAVDTGEIHEQSDLALVETVAERSVALDMAVMEAATDSGVQFNDDGTIDMVIIRPCNGRGMGNRIYEAATLQRDAGVFAGWPMYDNHESPEAKRARRGLPRPPSDLAGEIRESWYDANFTAPHDTEMGFEQGAVIGRCMLTEDMEKLVRRLPRAVKTSVNGQATGLRAGTRLGRRGMIVEGFVNDPENSSVDLVTKAGAGGQVASLFRSMSS